MKEKDIVKLGKITKNTQRALNLDFGKDDKVYVLEDTLNEFASTYATSYLIKLHEVTYILNDPDIAIWNQSNEEIHLFKLYYINNQFRIVGVTCHRDGQFYFDKIYSVEDKTTYESFEG